MSRNHLALVSSAQPATEETSTRELEHLLARAAKLAAAHDLDSDAFLHAAWTAFLEARPELRDELEDKELRAQLRKLRRQGLVGSA